jgi:small subunit ribosomal protein S8
MNDRIADMMIRIKNAGAVALPTATVPYTKIVESICALLKKEGYITDYSTKGKKASNKMIEVTIAYDGKSPKLSNVERLSKLSRRIYAGFSDIKPVKNGHGMLVMSTPKGILTGKQARKEKVGGELLFKVW